MQEVISHIKCGLDLAGLALSNKASRGFLAPGFWQPRELRLPVDNSMLG